MKSVTKIISRPLVVLALLALTLVGVQPLAAAAPEGASLPTADAELALEDLLVLDHATPVLELDPCLDCLMQCEGFQPDQQTVWQCQNWCYQTVRQCQ